VALLAAAALCLLWTGNGIARGLPAKDGILNFGKVNDSLYRGAQPDAAAFRSLKQLGVKAIVDLRQPGRGPRAEAVLALGHGILYTNIPMSGVQRPKAELVNDVLRALETVPGPVFVHCEHGCDRTGTIVACYRIKHDNWSNEAAMREAELFGISKLERGMKAFIAEFRRTKS
jgi:protein tyrosine/serine phosphatase